MGSVLPINKGIDHRKVFKISFQIKICGTGKTTQQYQSWDETHKIAQFFRLIGYAEKLTSRFWVLNRESNGSLQVSFLFKSL
jgi:hypothetical protein